MSHYILKLISGETIYAKLVASESNSKMLVLEDPLVWEEYETEEGSGSALVSYIAGTDEPTIPVSTSSVISMAGMNTQFANFYEAALALQDLTRNSYKSKLQTMTDRMIFAAMELHAKKLSDDTDDLVAHSTDITIH